MSILDRVSRKNNTEAGSRITETSTWRRRKDQIRKRGSPPLTFPLFENRDKARQGPWKVLCLSTGRNKPGAPPFLSHSSQISSGCTRVYAYVFIRVVYPGHLPATCGLASRPVRVTNYHSIWLHSWSSFAKWMMGNSHLDFNTLNHQL